MEKCTCIRIVDGKDCQARASYEIKFGDKHIGYCCGVHARDYTRKSLFKLATSTGGKGDAGI